MTYARKCPECGEALPSRAKNCSCGWLRHSDPAKEPSTTRCAYPGCPARGTLYDAPYGGGQAWCRWHYGDRGASGAQIAEDLVRKGVPQDGDFREELLQSKIAQHPERQKQSGESSKQYTRRMLRIFQETRAAASLTLTDDEQEARLEREAIQAE